MGGFRGLKESPIARPGGIKMSNLATAAQAGGGEQISRLRIGSNWKLRHTGASYTTVFDVYVYFMIRAGQVVPCPVHMEVVKGCKNSRYIYQMVPSFNYAVLSVVGSANPNTGPTPTQIREAGAERFLEIHASGKYARLFLRSAKSGVIMETLEDICDKVPGRFCYYPPAQFVPQLESRTSYIPLLLITIKNMEYPEYSGSSWYKGGIIKTGEITPTMQGNLVGTSKVRAPALARLEPDSVRIANTDEIVLKGNEGNDHIIKFNKNVDVLWLSSREVLVAFPVWTSFTITHPQHETVTGAFKGIVRFIHLPTE